MNFFVLSFGSLLFVPQWSQSAGCGWSGTMSGYLATGTCPTPGTSNGPTNCTVTPSYDETNNLWACPDGNDAGAANVCTCSDSSDCTAGTGDSDPVCDFDMSQASPGCCCTIDGCYVTPSFNWIISTCQGSGCGGYSWTGTTQTYKDIGSQVVVNYVAAYQYNSETNLWELSADSSFNTDGTKPAFDLVKPQGGLTDKADAWLSPQPGGAADWNWGYYPAGVTGVGPPGMLFVLSTQESYNFAWFMLNQLTLDRGPSIIRDDCSVTNVNCWSAANAGEIDFLEPTWSVDVDVDNYRRLYATQWNQIGRCFVGDQGSSCNADGGWFDTSTTTNNFFMGTDPVTSKSKSKNKSKSKEKAKYSNETDSDLSTAYVWVAVVDSVGTFIYRIPSDSVSTIWPGLTATTAECTLQNKPSVCPPNNGPPCDDSQEGYCALFMPNCQATSWGGAAASGGLNEGCKVDSTQGWCNNWWSLFTNTGQWLWPEVGGTPAVVNFQLPAEAVQMPWNAEMESWKVDWSGNAQYSDSCCIDGQGYCPKVNSTTQAN